MAHSLHHPDPNPCEHLPDLLQYSLLASLTPHLPLHPMVNIEDGTVLLKSGHASPLLETSKAVLLTQTETQVVMVACSPYKLQSPPLSRSTTCSLGLLLPATLVSLMVRNIYVWLFSAMVAVPQGPYILLPLL